MKHIYNNISIALAAVLLLSFVSCQKDESIPVSADGETGIVTFDFNLDESLTKADGNVSSFGTGVLNDSHELVWQLYVDDEAYASSEPVQKGTMSPEGTSLGKLELNLQKKNSYRILFFLYSKDCAAGAYDLSDLRRVSLTYPEHAASDDAYDIFCASASVTPVKDKAISVTLRRPTTQINIADKVADWAAASGYDKMSVSVAEAGTVLDAATGKAVSTGEASYAAGTVASYQFGVASDYFLRSMVYVLPTENSSDIIIEFTKEGSFARLVVENVTLSPNTRVNIIADDLVASIPASQKTEQVADGVYRTQDGSNYTVSTQSGFEYAAAQILDGTVTGKKTIVIAENTQGIEVKSSSKYTVPADLDLTIDWNGNDVTGSISAENAHEHTSLFNVQKGGRLVLDGEGTISITAGNNDLVSAMVNNQAGEVVINGGTYVLTAPLSWQDALIPTFVDCNSTLGEAKLTINGGSFTFNRNLFRCFCNNASYGAYIIINDGEFNGHDDDSGAIWIQNTSGLDKLGSVTLNGGTFNNVTISDEFGDRVINNAGVDIVITD